MSKKKIKDEITIEDLKRASTKPPEAVEIEREVLGAMLIEPGSVPKVIEVLLPNYFFNPKHEIIYEAMLSLFNSNEPIDVVTVYEELRKKAKAEAAGGAAYLSELSQQITSAANVDYHSRIVMEKWILRELIRTAMQIADSAYKGQDDVFDILDDAEKKVFEITEQGLTESYKPMSKAVKEAIEHIEAIHSQKLSQFAVPTGYTDLDEMLGGFQPSDLIIIAARPSMGKTAFALSMARNVAVQDKMPVAIFSLEMSTVQLVTRLISAEAKINAHSIRTGKFKASEGSRISKTAHKLSNAKIFIDDTASQTVLQIRAKARRLKAEHGIKMVIIDYLQLMVSAGRVESREREISNISRSLKALAKELSIPVVALSQLNRSVEQTNTKRPMLSHLRESGAIEQDADVVLFLYRPEAYGIMQDQDGNSTDGIAEIIIGKQRNGPIGSTKLSFIKEYARFENLDLIYSDMEPQQIEAGPEDEMPI